MNVRVVVDERARCGDEHAGCGRTLSQVMGDDR